MHMSVFRLNRRRNHKFIFSVLLYGFCMARITAVSMRMAWASKPNNPRLEIAANVFVLLGGLILIIVNLFFTQRLLRAIQPRLGWNPCLNKIFWVLLGSIASALLLVIVTTVHYFFTLDAKTRRAERILLLTGSAWLTSSAFLPVVAIGYLLWSLFKPAVEANQMENFGEGSLLCKILLLLFASSLTTLGAGFRLGANFDARPLGHAAWYHSRAAFYIFNFSIETVIVKEKE
ncbi:hypothetical protein N0V85_006840 [Neurospora sp. IMI 360204]|nr:hypothetical protein N0V85_006840 [Neurospora sp. IMI 360204]